jgi:tripartite-type tricarboxylate transporter receptor subunit TctC
MLFRSTVLLALCATAPSAASAADAYPTRPVRMIVAYPPGGGTDIVGRMMAQKLGEAFAQTVVIDNRGGATGNIGTELAARANPDGYTLLMGNVAPNAINVSLFKKLPYDPVKDFAPVSLVAITPNILVVNPTLPVKTVKDLVALAKAKPGVLNFPSAGVGSSSHLAGELLKILAKVDMVHVPYKGGGPALIAVVAGEVPVTFGTAASVSPHTRSGRLRALAVTSGKRSAVLPDLPTIAEAGLPGYEMLNWLGLFAPAGTPRPIVDRLASEALRIVRQPDIVSRFKAQASEPSPLGTDEFAAFVRKEVEKWGKVVAATGMTAE